VDKESWLTSKSIPLALVGAILLQTIAVVWYMAGLDSSVETNMRDIARHEIRIAKLETSAQELSLMNARIDENIKSIRLTLEKMAGKDG
jgi:hypothetical protein